MSISEPFIKKPIATTLLVVAITLAGAAAYRLLPVSPLSQVDFPTISVSASLPGASPETMASSVATPLERQFGHIAAVAEMTSMLVFDRGYPDQDWWLSLTQSKVDFVTRLKDNVS